MGVLRDLLAQQARAANRNDWDEWARLQKAIDVVVAASP